MRANRIEAQAQMKPLNMVPSRRWACRAAANEGRWKAGLRPACCAPALPRNSKEYSRPPSRTALEITGQYCDFSSTCKMLKINCEKTA